MSLIDLPRAVLGGAFRVARLPLDLLLGSSSDDREPDPAPAPEQEEHPTETAEQRQQADALQRAVNGQR